MVPHFTTSLTGPLHAVERAFIDATPRIERWFRLEWQEHSPPFYCSVDLRNAGFKLAPVDTNLYPGGFNNLSAEAMPLAVQAAMVAIEKYCPDARNLLLIPENHTRNTYYLQNVQRIQSLLRQTGLDVRLGSLNPEVTGRTEVPLPDGQSLVVEPLVRTGGRVGIARFDPCAILLNNDLSAGIPDILRNLSHQTLLPPLHAGWAVRRKSKHFAAYADVARRFAKLLDVDPWWVTPYFATCGQVDFQAREGEQCLAENVDATLKLIRAKYREYRIESTPFVIVKADAGTYGMGIMSVKDPSEVQNLSRRQRNKMAVVKEGLEVSEVIIQEGVPTIERVDDATAEPVVYMIDKYVVGGFYRVHGERGIDENLNAPGSRFVPLPFEASCNLPDSAGTPGCPPNRFYAYGVVARLALLAASVELERTDPDPTRFG
jgi:glutamate--cysteine ligase